MPDNSSTDKIVEASRQLTHALNNPFPQTPFEYIGDEEVTALKRLSEIFNEVAPKEIIAKDLQRVVPSKNREQPSQRVSTKTNQNNTI